MRLAGREQLVCDAFWFPEKLCLQRIENERQEELPILGLYLITSAGPLVNPFIPGQVEFERLIGFRQVRDPNRSKILQDLVEDLIDYFGRPTAFAASASKHSVVPKELAYFSKKLLTLSTES